MEIRIIPISEFSEFYCAGIRNFLDVVIPAPSLKHWVVRTTLGI